jgi:hypothetical protein
VALLAAGCHDRDPSTESSSIDPTVLELVAPTDATSLRTARPLRERALRASYEARRTCLEGLGYRNLPPFRLDPGRSFDFPDAADLRRSGFHVTVAPSVEPPVDAATTVADERDAVRCAKEGADRAPYSERQRRLERSWMDVFIEVEARPEEQRAWDSAARCLAKRGYPGADLESEQRFVGSLNSVIEAGGTIDERQRRELEAARDYVDCAAPVWSARAAEAKRRRVRWVEQHDQELRTLTAELRRVH